MTLATPPTTRNWRIRRRDQVAPTDPVSRRDNYYTNSESVEGAPEDPVLTEDGGYPVAFSCEHTLEGDVPRESITIVYDYEATFAPGTSITEKIDELEFSMLRGMVDTLELYHCDLGLNTSTRALTMSDQEPDVKSAVFEISSTPQDQTLPDVPCRFLADDPGSCFVIKGSVTAGMREDVGVSGEQVEALLMTSARYHMSDSRTFLPRGVNSAYFVGASTSLPRTISPDDSQSSKSDISGSKNGLSPSLLGILLSASGFVAIMAAVFFVFRRRRAASIRDEGHGENDKQEIGSPTDSAEGIFTLEAISTSDSSDCDLEAASVTALPEEEPTGSVSQLIFRPVNGSDAPLDQAHQPHRNTPERAMSLPAISTEIAGEPPGVLDVSSIPGMPAAGLPPRPPLQRRPSQKLKKRRKKKKKKKTVLRRVNSKENMNEMETIPESDAEDSDGTGSEFESDYGTDEDGSSSTPSSGMNTPVRVRSNPPSRSSTPKFSPTDELFPADVFGELSFDVAAPLFPDKDAIHDNQDDRLSLPPRPKRKIFPKEAFLPPHPAGRARQRNDSDDDVLPWV